MLKIIKNFNWIIASFLLCILLGILTFLTLINEGFISLTEKNLNSLFIADILVLILFFYLIIKNSYKFYNVRKKISLGLQTKIKYVSVFSLFTFIPSFLVAIFSLFIFNFGVENYFDSKVTKAVNNSYDVAKNYLNDNKKNVESDIILMSVGLNRASQNFYVNPKRFQNIIKAEKNLRRIDEVYLIDSAGNILISEVNDIELEFVIPTEDNFNQALKGNAVSVSNILDNKTSVMIKLNTLVDTYLYISRNIDPEILKYLNETEEAVSFYYSVENSLTGIKITFALIYIVVVTLLLFLSITFAISFASRLTKPIINLIEASEGISKGELNSKVPEIDVDDEFKMLNKNFNNMIERLKKQQDKLLAAERYLAWETVARKLAHEIKNPLTPIQLSIDILRNKYSKKLSEGGNEFENYLQTINRQIKDIEKLVNEFSNFARMPSPILRKIDVLVTLRDSINFISMSSDFTINLKENINKNYINGDKEQLNRVFINLIKNSQESFLELKSKKADFKGKIDIEIVDNNDYIIVKLQDNGTGITDTEKAMTPYFTTKTKGTGLGLPIVSKIINDHKGDFIINNNKQSNGLEITMSFPKII
jgi:two-component system nitrogen regulation sensor histidine kinase NtrY